MTTNLGQGRLASLVESARLLHTSLEPDALLSHLLRSVMGGLLVRKALLAVHDGDGHRVTLVRGCPEIAVGSPFEPGTASRAGIEEVLPIGDGPEPLGLLGIGRPATGPLDEEAREYLVSLLGLAAGALTNARAHAETERLNRELSSRVLDLRTLLEHGRGLAAALDAEEVARLLALTLQGRFMARRLAAAAWKDGHPTVVRQRGVALPEVESLAGALEPLEGPANVDALPEGALRAALAMQGLVLLVPLRSGDHLLGFVALGPPATRAAYEASETDFVAGLAAQAATAFENAWNVSETVARKNLERELSLAHDIQSRLFPNALPEAPGFEIAARNRPARAVGGDYYDALTIAGGEILGCVADVSGKGIAASLLMSSFRATLHALVTPRPPMADLATRMNELVFASTPATKYVTALFFALDPATGAVRWVNAGHNDGILRRADGTLERLKACGTPIGLLPLGRYAERSLDLRPGDLLVLYSDGVTEAQSPEEEDFGDPRLVDLMHRAAAEGWDATRLVDETFAAVDAFAASAPQYDDITALAVRRTG